MITDEQSLDGATRNGDPLPVWDNGFGSIWAVWDNVGHCCFIIGIVRAQTLEEAWETAADEIFPGPDAEEIEEYESQFTEESQPDLPEGWTYRGSGEPANERKFPHINSLYGVYSLDIYNIISPLKEKYIEEQKITLSFS